MKVNKSIDALSSVFNFTYQALDPMDVDYKLFKDGIVSAYAEVVQRNRNIRNAYPLFISARKLMKLIDKRITGYIIWACDDGIIYAKADELVGEIKWGELPPPENINNMDMVIFYEKQKPMRYIRFTFT